MCCSKLNCKSIKKISKIVVIFLLAVFTLPTIGYILIGQERVQDYLVRKISLKLTAFFGAPVTISSVHFDLFNTISLHDFCVHSPHSDTILYTSQLDVRLNTFTLSSRFLEFKKVTIARPDIHFYVDSTNTINFQFIIDKLQPKDTSSSSKSMVVSIREIDINNANFTLRSFVKMKRDYGLNFSDLHLHPLDVKVTNFRIDHGVSMNIRHFSAHDRTGFDLKELSSRFKMNKQNMIFNNLNILTSQSNINASQVHFNFGSTKEFRGGIFGKKVNLDIKVDPSDVAAEDVAWFLPVLKDYHLKARISGNFYGHLNDLKGKNIEIQYGKKTRIKGDMDINGLPDIASSFLHFNFKSLYTTPTDIESIRIPKKGRVILPDNFRHLTFISYRGKFTGFFNDFVTYGTISTNLGKIDSDISLKPDTANYFSFNGKVKASQFDIGTFTDKSNLFGRISFDAMISGNAGSMKNIRARLNGVVSSFDFNRYNYQNIKIDGNIFDNTYDGTLSIADPNINLDFQGRMNLSGQIPTVDFKVNVTNAKLHRLNIDQKDSSSSVSFYATANLEGNNIDNLNGEVKLWNSNIKRGGKEIQINDFLLFTKNINDTNRIILRSDIADGELWGNYQFRELGHSFISFLRNYLPSVVANKPLAGTGNNNFKFEVAFKNTRQVTDFFIPGLYISKDTKLSGTFNPARNYLDFQMTIPLLQHNSKKWYEVYFNGKTENNSFSLISGCKDLKINNQLDLQNFALESDIRKDSMNIRLRWNNWDTVTYKGNFFLSAAFSSSPGQQYPTVKLDIKPSQVILKDTVWSIRSGMATINQYAVSIDQLLISHANQTVKINGVISKDEKQDHTLSAEFRNVDLGNLSTVLNTKKIYLDGIVNGNVSITNIYTNPTLRSSLAIDSFAINHVRLGDTKMNAVFDNSDKEVKVDAFSLLNSIKTLDIKGGYSTVTKKLDFTVGVNKLKLDLFEPYVSNIFSDVRGIATGSVELTGTISDPELNGSVKVQKASFVVNYLKTRYNFAHTVDIKNNVFLLKNVEVYDDQERPSKALVNGQIDYRGLKELYSDVRISAKNFKCLATTERDNNLFYGQGFASGNVKIHTLPQSVSMDIDASTDPHTLISIPLTTKVGQTESNYIHIVNKSEPPKPFEDYEIDKATESKKFEVSTNKFKLNCNLHVTPDAETQIVFDQKIGDMIKGSGSGDLNMVLDGGVFNMYGSYVIDQGVYLFTLQNVINKKFIVDQGGIITWNGNPLEATININAIYKTSASLYQLTADPQYQKLIPIQCRLFLTNRLLSPTIQYDIYLPEADQETRNLLKNNITTDEEESKQFLALLIANSFIPNTNSAPSSGGLGKSAATSTGLEFLSNQLSRMLSQFTKDFDIGFNYHPGDDVTTGQAELAISTQLWNDRLSISGNVDVGGNQAAATQGSERSGSNIVGEGSVEFKLTNNGKLRLKAYNKSNNQGLNIESIPYTQGAGVFYREDFNSFKDLLKNYFHKIFGRKEKNKLQPAPDTEDDSADNTE